MDLCLAGVDSLLDAPTSCRAVHSEIEMDSCSIGAECAARVDLGDGFIGEYKKWSDVWCRTEEVGWSCDCSSANMNGRVVLSADQNEATLCSDVLTACAAGLMDPDREVTCTPGYHYEDAEMCEVLLDCSQASTVAGQAVTVSHGRNARCHRSADGSWDCYCGGGPTSYKLQGEGARDVCSSFATQCSL